MNNTRSTSQHIVSLEAIRKKLIGRTLSYKEIYAIMDEIAHQRLSDVITAYFAAAGFKEGFSDEELYFLTKAMVETGKTFSFDGIVADKHSTGGVSGTRTTMIVVPIIAAAGYTIPKISSRAITTPAGTADCMETIAHVSFSPSKLYSIVKKTGGCIAWNGDMNIAPADDVLIKVEEPLSFESFDKIIVSIMAKKVAIGANHLVLDIPIGKTMKIKYEKDAHIISKKFKLLAKKFNMNISVYINNMMQPAGTGIGAYLETIDALKVLERKPDKPQALEDKALLLAGKLLDLCFTTSKKKNNGLKEAQHILFSGKAHQKMTHIIAEQGGNPYVSSDQLKEQVLKKKKHVVISDKNATISEIDNRNVNSLAKILGAPHDKFAGIEMYKKIKEKVQKGEPLLQFYSSSQYKLDEAIESISYLPIYSYSP